MRYIISPILTSLPLMVLPFTAIAEVPQVITDIPAVQALVAQVMGDLGTPTLLLTKGADEHDFQLRPSQMQAISEADLTVWIGPELTPWLERALQSAGPDMISLPLLDLEGTQTRMIGTPRHDDHEVEPEPNPAADGHDHSGIDPHAWLDPANAVYWLDMIAVELASVDPDNALTYTANATAAKLRVQALDSEIAALLAPVKDRAFITYHDAYGYFTDHYGLHFAGSVATSEAAAPGAAHLVELQKTIVSVQCVFPEKQHDPALLLQLVEGSTTRVGEALDPVGSGLEPGPDAYDALLHGLASTLAACLNGA